MSNTEQDLPTVVQALSEVMSEVGAVRKEQVNQHQRFNFRGVDAVVNAVSPALRRHGVVVAPTLLEKELKESRTAKGAVMANVYLTVEYTFYGPAGDSISATVAAESFDSGDKATAKAMSVAFRTALLQTLALPTDEVDDPDHSTYERAASTPAPPPAPVPPTEEQTQRLATLVEEVGLDDARFESAVKWATRRRGLSATGDFAKINGQEMAELITALEGQKQKQKAAQSGESDG